MPTVQLLDSTGAPIDAATIQAARMGAMFDRSPYRSASVTQQETYAWRPDLMSADSAVLPARELAGARADDIIRNDPHAVAGVMRLVDMLVGAGIRYSPKPNTRALGIDMTTKEGQHQRRDLAESLKSEWSLFASDPMKRCDAQRRLSMNGQWRRAARTMARRGEATGFLAWKRDAGARYATCVRWVDPDRLSNPNLRADSKTVRGGIEYDPDGVPLAYHVRTAHPGDWQFNVGAPSWERIVARTSWGRPVFIHGFEPEREDQSRAISPFAVLLTRLRMIGKHADSELASAAVNALFAAFMKSNLPVAEAAQAMTPVSPAFADKRMDYYLKNPPTLNGVRIPVFPIGDEMVLNSTPRQTTAFAAFQAAFLQSIAAALGVSYEQLSMDWSKVNYSSARAALNEVWRHIQTLFAVLVEHVIAPIHFAVIEEAFDRRYIVRPKGSPDFWDLPAAYLGARWIGPGRGYVDPTKEAEASNMRMDALTSTLEDESAEQGRDFEETLDQLQIEQEMLAERDLVRVSTLARPQPQPSVEQEQRVVA
jgi:lambda family phage portal protein